MKFHQPLLRTGGLLCALILFPAAWVGASDHADTAGNYNRPGADLADVFIFPSTTNSKNVVLVMDVHPLIPAGQATMTGFDPNVLYQFRIDNTGDNIEDLVIQARFSGAAPNQKMLISGPYKPNTTGLTSVFARPYATSGTINQTFSPTPGMTVFAGGRSDPFFFDLEQFFVIFPDRATPQTGQQVNYPSIMAADTPQTLLGFRGFPANSGYNSAPARDILTSFNVLSIVVELPRASLVSPTSSVIHLWETTSILSSNFTFTQQDRLARPAINEALATVSQLRHEMNNKTIPTNDINQIGTDIQKFMSFPAGYRSDGNGGFTSGRSQAITNVLLSVLVPDVMIADLSNMTDPASYLGVETKGATGGTFGGRALVDDVIDIDLGAVFGGTIPALKLAPDDGRELPQFSTDNVGPHNDYMRVFPYLGNPH